MIRTIAITGATGTLGAAVARRIWQGNTSLSRLFFVRACSRRGADKIGTAHPFPVARVNVANPHCVNRWFDEIGHVDALVTCAGVSAVKPSLELTAAEWGHVLDVNLTGTFLCAREAVRHEATRIVTVGSIHGCTPTSYPERAAYTASKGGVKALTEALAVEFAGRDPPIAVNCVAPGHLPVLMDGTGAGQALLDAARERTPMKRLATPEEVADVIYWLCTDAPITMTGQTLVIDGGFTLNTYPLE